MQFYDFPWAHLALGFLSLLVVVAALDYFLFAHGKVPILWRFGFEHHRPYPCPCTDPNYASAHDLTGNLIVITGGSEGIGKATALELARTGANIIVGSRDEGRALAAIADIKTRVEGAKISYERLDLTSTTSVRAFASRILATLALGSGSNSASPEPPNGPKKNSKLRLYALINNAGVMLLPRKIIVEQDEPGIPGLEMTMAVNYFGPFLLTNLLLPALEAGARDRGTPSRVINVSSRAHVIGNTVVDCSNLNSERHFDRSMAYGNSKLALVTWTAELARRTDPSLVLALSLHPGTVDTDLFKHVPAPARWLVRRWFAVDVTRGARTSLFCTLADPAILGGSGTYYSECRRTTPSSKAQDLTLAKSLWQTSCKICGLEEPRV